MNDRMSDASIILIALSAGAMAFGLTWWWGGLYAVFIVGFPMALIVGVVVTVALVRRRRLA